MRVRQRDAGGRPAPDEVDLGPLPERDEANLDDPGPTDLSHRDWFAILRRAVKAFNADNMSSIAAALAYYAFLSIPSAMLIAIGAFSLVAGPSAISTVVDKLGAVAPTQVTTLVHSSLTRMTEQRGTGLTVLLVGSVLALWSLTGAMQNVMWASNIAYGREETRGFVRRRLTALVMVVFWLLAFVLAVGVLVLGPHLSSWIGDALGATELVHILWWVGEWPLLVLGLGLAFAGLMHLAPNVKHPRWHFVSLGAIVTIVVWLAASAAFAFYVSRFGSYNKAWGSLAAVVIMLTWLWLSSAALLLGIETNSEAQRSRELRQGLPAEDGIQAPAKA